MKYIILIIALSVNFVLSEDCKETHSKLPRIRVKKYIMCNYSTDEPPANTDANGTTVWYGVLPKTGKFDEETENFELHAMLYEAWEDSRLSWEPEKFENISTIYVNRWRLWTPEVAVRSFGGGEMSYVHQPCIVVAENGRTACLKSVTLSTRCKTDFALWPHDRQNCTLILGAWTFTTEHFKFQGVDIAPVIMDYYSSNGDWTTTVTRIVVDDVQSEYFPDKRVPVIKIDFILDRIAGKMSAVYITPGIILVITTLTTLWLDPKSIERLYISCMNLILHYLCIEHLHWSVPHNGPSVPNIHTCWVVLFYMTSFVLAVLALVLTFGLRKMQSLKSSPPRWVVTAGTFVLRSKIGQIFLLSVLDPKASAGMEDEADDTGDLVANSSSSNHPAWNYFTLLVGWITFISSLLVYIVTYSLYVPNSSMKPVIERATIRRIY